MNRYTRRLWLTPILRASPITVRCLIKHHVHFDTGTQHLVNLSKKQKKENTIKANLARLYIEFSVI